MKNLIYYVLISVVFYNCKNSPTTKTFNIPSEITTMYSKYVSAQSDADFTTISEEIYELPFTLYLSDSTITYKTKKELVSFLTNSFNTLEENNYGYSITNSWEHYKKDDNIVVNELDLGKLTNNQRIQLIKAVLPYLISKQKNTEDLQQEQPLYQIVSKN